MKRIYTTHELAFIKNTPFPFGVHKGKTFGEIEETEKGREYLIYVAEMGFLKNYKHGSNPMYYYIKDYVYNRNRRKEEKKEYLRNPIKLKCKFCNNPIHAIGDKRKNGKKGTKDFLFRPYHKSCYKDYHANILF